MTRHTAIKQLTRARGVGSAVRVTGGWCVLAAVLSVINPGRSFGTHANTALVQRG